MAKRLSVTEQLRKAIKDRVKAGDSLYKIAKDADVMLPTVTRFVKEERDMAGLTIDKLCESLGLELRERS